MSASDPAPQWPGPSLPCADVLGGLRRAKGAGDKLREPGAGAIDGEQPQTVEHYDEFFAVAVLGEDVWYAVEDSVGPLDTDDVARKNFMVIANQQPVHVDSPQG